MRFVESHLYGITAYDRRVWTLVAGLVVSVALGGTLVPSVRAARVDPVRALRVE